MADPSSPLKKGTGTSRLVSFAGFFTYQFGASPLFQRISQGFQLNVAYALG